MRKLLKDYKKTSFLIEEVKLNVNILEEAVIVTSILTVKRNLKFNDESALF
jgi:hypothetical protein